MLCYNAHRIIRDRTGLRKQQTLQEENGMKTLKIGIFGAGRGADIAANFQLLGCEITAICDFHEKRRKNAVNRLGGGIAEYEDFDSFIEHDMDAVVLANFFHEHAPYAIRCMEKGIQHWTRSSIGFLFV